MENRKDNLPEPKSAKKVNNKLQYEYILAMILLAINIFLDGVVGDIAGIACIIVSVAYIVKTLKNRKK